MSYKLRSHDNSADGSKYITSIDGNSASNKRKNALDLASQIQQNLEAQMASMNTTQQNFHPAGSTSKKNL